MTPSIQAIFDWLVDGAPGAPTPMATIARMGDALIAAGVPIARISAAVRTLHPHIAGRGFSWTPGEEVVVVEVPYTVLGDPGAMASPVMEIFTAGREIQRRLDGTPTGFQDLDELRAEGFTGYLGLPLRFIGGTFHVISFATRAPGGFSDEHLAALRQLARPLSRVAEIFALMRTAANLLNAYVGRGAGDRILQGRVQRGDTESIHCVIWFSDLRGFTTLSGERRPSEIIAMLNELFDCQVPAIERGEGEVLKFIGDGLLAIFPFAPEVGPAAAGARAVAAAREAFAALDTLNGVRAGRGDEPLQFGVALHVGDVAYGNIGGAARLDFTAIGPAVNVASRIEGLTGKLGKPLLLSGELARALTLPVREVGAFELKGVARPQSIFEPG